MFYSSFNYLQPIAEAYSSINEAFPKEIKKLLDTVYKPEYKDDGYDQFGVDRNGKNRRGNVVIWRYPDRWFGDVNSLKNMLSQAKSAETAYLGKTKHNYDRFGFDVLGYDRNGFDLNDKDILGHSGSEFGTEEYKTLNAEREHARHNLHSKNGMREHNYVKKYGEIPQRKYEGIVKAYNDAMEQPNPKAYFEERIRPFFIKQLEDGRITLDKTEMRYFLNKFKFVDKDSFKMTNTEFMNRFISVYREQLERIFRPKSAENYFNISVESRNEITHGLEVLKCYIHVKVKDELIKTMSKSEIIKLMDMAKTASNRIKLVLPYSGYDYWTLNRLGYLKIVLSVDSEEHHNISNDINAMNAEGEYEQKYGLREIEDRITDFARNGARR